MSSVFIGGGGSAEQSKQLDEVYREEVERAHKHPTCLYIPWALPEDRHDAAFEWFQDSYSFFSKATLLRTADDARQFYNSVYLGGGYTHHLLDSLGALGIRRDLFHDALSSGTTIYGGSAGGVLLGKSLLTAREVMRDPEAYETKPTEGFNICQDMSFRPHFRGTDEEVTAVRELAKKAEIGVIALSEESGVVFRDDNTYEVVNEVGTYEVHP